VATNKLKAFLRKATSKKASLSAYAFLAQHSEFLSTGELAEFTNPILLAVDDKSMMPTPALERITEIVLKHHLAAEVKAAELAMAKADAPSLAKNYQATIYNAKGEIQSGKDPEGKFKKLQMSFELSARAEGWADRRLFDGASDWYAIVTSTKMFRANGEPFSQVIMRVDSIARILKGSKGPAMKRKKQSSTKLGWGVKVRNDHCNFSRG
jgi:hypothetical protein